MLIVLMCLCTWNSVLELDVKVRTEGKFKNAKCEMNIREVQFYTSQLNSAGHHEVHRTMASKAPTCHFIRAELIESGNIIDS